MEGEPIIRWSIRGAMVLYACVLGLAIAGRRAPATTPIARLLWTVGCWLFVAHVLSAFAFYHDWSHRHAFLDTKEKTEAAIGLAFGWGIYVNHFFAILWIADVAWCWAAPASHRQRPAWLTATLHTFMLFIAVNGLMIFKGGAIRWTSAAVLLLLLVGGAVKLGMRNPAPPDEPAVR